MLVAALMQGILHSDLFRQFAEVLQLLYLTYDSVRVRMRTVLTDLLVSHIMI